MLCLVCMAAQLDAGVPEKILLMSRDEQSMLVASYADLKVCALWGHGGARRGAWGRGRAHGASEGHWHPGLYNTLLLSLSLRPASSG